MLQQLTGLAPRVAGQMVPPITGLGVRLTANIATRAVGVTASSLMSEIRSFAHESDFATLFKNSRRRPRATRGRWSRISNQKNQRGWPFRENSIFQQSTLENVNVICELEKHHSEVVAPE